MKHGNLQSSMAFILLASVVSSFTIPNPNVRTNPIRSSSTGRPTLRHRHSALHLPSFQLNAKSKKSKSTSNSFQFEQQELRAQLSTIISSSSSINPKNIAPQKQTELESYLRTILTNVPSPISLRALGNDGGKVLHGTWKLAFATSSGTSTDSSQSSLKSSLPPGANVVLNLEPEYKCTYTLSFSKRVMGLSKLTAQSTYTIDSSPLNPGLVSIFYQDIMTDMFGQKNVNIGFLTGGMLKGRVTYVETVWFDGVMWVERLYGEDGTEMWNVYVKDSVLDEDDEW